MKKEVLRKIGIVLIFIIVIVVIFLTIYGMTYYRRKFLGDILENSDEADQSYTKHVALILEDVDSDFGESIYEGAKVQGEELGIYVENFGKALPFDYSLEERLKMAMTSGVDGIIIQGGKNENITEQIDYASKSGIPVVTILDDAPISSRICFVGVNQHQLGKSYGNQILKAKDDQSRDIESVLVLLDTNEQDKGYDIIFSSIKESLSDSDVEVDAKMINRQTPFSVEEIIHDIIMVEKDAPDLIVCINPTDTITAYQILVDYNKVGEIGIIGYYNSEVIERAIERNIIDSTIVINTGQIGEYSVETLGEYLDTGMVNEYISVDIDIVE